MDADPLKEAPHLKKIVDKIAVDKGFKQPKYHVTSGTKPGDNYLGALYRAEITEGEPGKECTKEPLTLILKTAPACAARREMMVSNVVFRHEATMYNTVLRTFAKLLADNWLIPRGSSYPDAPECLFVSVDGHDGEDTLVLRDMKPFGFVMHERRKGLDLEHSKIVVRTLARFHSCSMTLEHSRPEQFKDLRDNVTERIYTHDSHFKPVLQASVNRTDEIIRSRYPVDTPEYARLKKFLDNYFKEMCDAVLPDPEGGNSLLHGDCWTNNFLFKYSKTQKSKVESVCLLDFQLTRYGSPVLDLLYYLHVCTERDLRKEHLDDILRAYHGELQDNLRTMGCDPDRIYSWERLQSQLKKYGKFGFGTAMYVVPLSLTDSEDIPDINTEFEKVVKEIFIGGRGSAARDKRICDVAEDMIDYGFL